MGHDLAFPFRMVKNGWRAVYQPEARASGEDGAVDRGRVGAQAADDVPRLADRRQGRPADPRGYSPLYALMIVSHRLLRYGTPFLHVLTALATLALLRRGGVYRLAAAAQRALVGAAASRSRRRARRSSPATTCSRPPRSRRPVRLAAPRHAGRLGSAGGNALNRVPALAPQARARPRRRRCRCSWSRAGRRARRARGAARIARAPDLQPAPRRPRRARVRGLQAAHDGLRRRAHGRRDGRRRGRRADHADRRDPAPHVDRRAAEPV